MKLKLYILLLFTTSLFAQKVTTSIDSVTKKIGAEFKLTLKTEVDSSAKVIFPKAQNFGAFEVIESYKIDTIKNGSRYQLIKKYGITQFDSGKYILPKLPVLINGKPIFSDSLLLEVADVKVDTLKQKMYDIKNIIPVESTTNWWKYFFGLLVLVLAAIGVYQYIKNLPKKEKQIVETYKSPIEKATILLQQLEKKELWQKGEIKNYYSELTNIARNYIEEEIHIPAMESTTSELIVSLRNVAKKQKLKLSAATLENLEKVLKQADLVKFAKVQPSTFEIEEDKTRIANSIVTIHKSIPVVSEQNEELAIFNEQQRQKIELQKQKKQKQIRQIKIAGIVLVAILIPLLSIIYFKGFDFVKDKVIGNPTKELLQEEWVFSEYGNPSVKIETPKVLQRQDVSKMLPKQALATVKNRNMFVYGNMFDSFYIMLTTTTFKQQAKIDLDKSIESSLQEMEKRGATSMLVKTEEFETQNGISGRKAFGTMTMVDMKKEKSERMYYELLVFGQDGGLQQLLIMYKDSDKYGKEIAERVLNSVELKMAQ